MQLVKDIGGALSRTAGGSNGASLDGFRPAASDGREFSAVIADFQQHFGELDRALVAKGKDRQRVLSWPEFWDAVEISTHASTATQNTTGHICTTSRFTGNGLTCDYTTALDGIGDKDLQETSTQ